MRRSIIGRAALTVIFVGFTAVATAQTLQGPVSDKPLDEKWAPSKWGARTARVGQPHQELGEYQARARHHQAVQGHHHRQVLPPRSAGLRRARLADEHSRHADRRPVRQERADLSRRTGHHRNRPDPDPVRRSRPHRREYLEGPDDLQRPHLLGCLRARRRRPRGRAWAPWASSTSANSASSAAWWCWTRWPTRSRKGTIPASAEMLPIPEEARRPRHRHGGRHEGHDEGARPQRSQPGRLRRAAHRPGQHLGQRPLQVA